MSTNVCHAIRDCERKIRYVNSCCDPDFVAELLVRIDDVCKEHGLTYGDIGWSQQQKDLAREATAARAAFLTALSSLDAYKKIELRMSTLLSDDLSESEHDEYLRLRSKMAQIERLALSVADDCVSVLDMEAHRYERNPHNE